MDVNNNKLIVNIILADEDLEKFFELKKSIGLGRPNTEIIRKCIHSTHKLLLE